MTITIYHNPACGTSRNVLALIRHSGADPVVVEYLNAPPDCDTLSALIRRSGLRPQDVVRKKEAPYTDLGLDGAVLDDAQWIAQMCAHPILINRPLVDVDGRTRLCRPSDVVLDLLGNVVGDFRKEDGAPFLRDSAIDGADAELAAALAGAGLPTDDLSAPGRSFFAYRTLAGVAVGYGGFERYGADVLIRSIVVDGAHRKQAIGRNLVGVLLYRAYVTGARRAWLLTTDAAGYFEKIGFKTVSRTDAPPDILATRQATSLCPRTAVLLSKALRL